MPSKVKNNSFLMSLVSLMRPKQWVKNIFVLAPLLFSAQFIHFNAITQTLAALFSFCLASSAVYIVNDLSDIEDDRKHPLKSKTRPIAAGRLSKRQAMSFLSLIYAVLIISAFHQPNVLIVICAYIAINMAYSFKLKNLAIVDIFTIASGFVLRIYAGAMALSVPVSSWMFVTSLCLALYLATLKRKQELIQNGDKSREVLKFYTVKLLDKYADISATGTLLFYSLFVMTARPQLIFTIPIVIFGFFRYWFATEILKKGESPTDLFFSDKPLALTVCAWFAVSLWRLWI